MFLVLLPSPFFYFWQITFQVKRVKKHKPENIDQQEPAGRNGEEAVAGENENLYQMALEISGTKIPSPGPPGNMLSFFKNKTDTFSEHQDTLDPHIK